MRISLPVSIAKLIFEASKRQWESVSVRDLITLSNGKSMTKSRMTFDGDYPVYGANGIIGKSEEYLVEQPTITVGRVGSCGEINLTTGYAWISDNAMWVSSIKEDIDYSFLYYGLKSLNLISGAKIAAMPSISQENVYRETIPLPPIKEQKIIAQYLDQLTKGVGLENRTRLPELIKTIEQTVARVESIAVRIAKAQSLRDETLEDAGNLLIVMAHRAGRNQEELLKDGWQEVRLGEIIHQVKDRYRVELNTDYPNLGIYSYARGLFHKQPIDGNLTSAKELYRVHKGQFIYSRLFAFEGACGIVTDEYDGCFVSGEYPTFDCDPSKVNPEFLFAYFKSLDVWRTVSAGSKGLGDRRQRVQPEKFLEHKLLLPPLEWQSKITTMMKKIDDLQSIQSATGDELSALLPSVLDRAFKGEL